MNVNIRNILFLDIENAPQHPSFDLVPNDWKDLWAKKAEVLLRNRENETVESIYGRAGIYAEFGKVICISCGVVQGNGSGRKILLKSFYGDDEKLLLIEFVDMLKKWAFDNSKFLCAHNGKEFDFLFLYHRLIIKGNQINHVLNSAGKKPWEVNHLDTMELWKFGDYKNYTSLNLLAYSLGIPTPKDDLDGSMVGDVYWKERNILRIVTYCQKDVVTVAQVFLRLCGEECMLPDQVEIK